MHARVKRAGRRAASANACGSRPGSRGWLAAWLGISARRGRSRGGAGQSANTRRFRPGTWWSASPPPASKIRLRAYTDESFSLLADFGPADVNELAQRAWMIRDARPGLVGLRRRPRQPSWELGRRSRAARARACRCCSRCAGPPRRIGRLAVGAGSLVCQKWQRRAPSTAVRATRSPPVPRRWARSRWTTASDGPPALARLWHNDTLCGF